MMQSAAQYILLLSLLASARSSATATAGTSSTTSTSSSSTSQHANNLRRRQTSENKIVGGAFAPLHSYPYYVQWAHGCSGVLFHDDLVLTAAHCNAAENAIKRFAVYVGGDGTHQSGTPMFATAGYEHPRYDPRLAHVYDFMVLKLPQKMEGIEFAPINSNPNWPVEGTPLTVVGHGLMDEDHTREDAPTIYREVSVPYIENCSPYYRQVQPGVQFCAGDMPNGGKDACQGDSGSGIFDDKGVLVGLVSWGIGCARPNRPGVYARVSTIERWLEHMKCQASDYPPAHCTDLSISFTVDDYPEELGLSILDADTANKPEAVVIPAGSLDATSGQTLQYTFSVPKGRDYIVRVQDTKKDGFCCDYGHGTLTITDGSLQYTLNPNFATEFASLHLPLVGGPDNTALIGTTSTTTSTTGATATTIATTTRSDSYSIKFMILYGEHSDFVTWKFSIRNTNDGTVSLIHEDNKDNPKRMLDDFNRQEVEFSDLLPGTYEVSVSDGKSTTNTGLSYLRVFALNTDGTASSLLYQLQGGETFSNGSFQVG